MLIRAVIALSLALTSYAANSEQFRSEVGDGYYVCRVDDGILAQSPQWHDLEAAPPLPLHAAMGLAKGKVRELRNNDTDVKWSIIAVDLRRPKPSSWYYVVTLRSHPLPTPDPTTDPAQARAGYVPNRTHLIRIPVLMSGEIPRIETHKYSNDLLELFQELGL